MRVAELQRQGPPEQEIRIREVPDPQPPPGGVVVRLRAASVNRRDAWICKGLYAKIQLPCVLGSDGAGEVIAAGAGVDPAWVGRKVVLNPNQAWGDDPRVQGKDYRILGMPAQGTFAGQIAVPVDRLGAMPPHLSFEQAACLPVAGITAFRALVTRGAIQTGEHVLVTGIGGGVATLALQFAKALGARVSVTSGSDEKLQKARALGAIGGARYDDPEWPKKLAAEAGGLPSLIADGAGGNSLNDLVNACAPAGRIVLYGATRGVPDKLDVRKIFFRQLDLRGATMGNDEEFHAMLRLVTERHIEPVVDRVLPLSDAATAVQLVEDSRQMGKIVLDCGA
jgi:zinc-binding alcohol dehydrogenase/oxidoreductase